MYHDTDSSNESFESDSSLRINVSNVLGMMNHEKWLDHLTDINSWKSKDDKILWAENRDKRWKNLPNSGIHPINWSESNNECFINNLIRAPIMQYNFPPPPPKPDSPPEV